MAKTLHEIFSEENKDVCSNCDSIVKDGYCPSCDAPCEHCGLDNFNCKCPSED